MRLRLPTPSFARIIFSSLPALLLCSACSFQSGPKPEVTIVNALVSDVNLLETGMEFTLKVTNHSPEPMLISGAVYRIYINDVDIGTGSSGEAFDVPRFSSATQKVRVGLSNLSMIHNIRDLVEAKRFDYRIEGEFYLKDGGAFRDKAYAENSARFDFTDFEIETNP